MLTTFLTAAAAIVALLVFATTVDLWWRRATGRTESGCHGCAGCLRRVCQQKGTEDAPR